MKSAPQKCNLAMKFWIWWWNRIVAFFVAAEYSAYGISKFHRHLATYKQRWREQKAHKSVMESSFLPSPAKESVTEFSSLLTTEGRFRRHIVLIKKFCTADRPALFLPLFNQIFVFVIVPNYKYISFPVRKYITVNPLDTNASVKVLSANLNQQWSQPSHTNQILSRVSSQFITNSCNAWKYRCTSQIMVKSKIEMKLHIYV